MRISRSAAAVPGEHGMVLVSDHVNGRSRSAVATVRALDAAGYRPVVAVSRGQSVAAMSRSCAGVLPVPSPDSPDYRKEIERFLASHPDAAVLAASDAALVALGQPGVELIDKGSLPERAAAAGLRVPSTRTFDDGAALLAAADELEYPLVAKPAVRARPGEVARMVRRPSELPSAVEAISGAVVVQPFARGTMRAVCGVVEDGQLLAVVHQTYVRIWPPTCGTASAAVTTHPDLDLEAKLPRLLAGHVGVFQVQLIDDQVIDINPRVYGSLPLAVAAGANLPAIACVAATGQRPSGLVRGRPGVRYQWLEGDIRRVVHDVRTGAMRLGDACRALLPHRGTAHSIESLRDPGPALIRLVSVAHKIRRGSPQPSR